jgi:hypothetical protein
MHSCVLQRAAEGAAPLKLFWTGSLASHGASTFISSIAYSGADCCACLYLRILREQCTNGVCVGVYICFTCAHVPSSATTIPTSLHDSIQGPYGPPANYRTCGLVRAMRLMHYVFSLSNNSDMLMFLP